MIVDDFLTGPEELALDDSGTQPGHATGTMLGSQRRTRLGVIARQGQRASLSIGPGPSSTGRLLVSTGVDTLATAELTYGVNAQDGPAPLNLDVTPFDRFAIDFSFIDFAVNVNIVAFTPEGWAASGHNVNQFLTPGTVGQVLTQDFLFSEFGGPGRGFRQIDALVAIFSFFGPIGGNDYQVEGIRLENGSAPVT